MVYLYLADGFEEVEAMTAVDYLRRAGIDCKLVSMTGERLVRGTHDIRIETDLLFEDADHSKCEMMILPGGIPGAVNLDRHKDFGKRLLDANKSGTPISAICAAPMVLGHLGILKGKKATIYPGMEHNLKGAIHVEEKVIHDGNIITSQGPATAVYFALEIIRTLKGAETAEELASDILL